MQLYIYIYRNTYITYVISILLTRRVDVACVYVFRYHLCNYSVCSSSYTLIPTHMRRHTARLVGLIERVHGRWHRFYSSLCRDKKESVLPWMMFGRLLRGPACSISPLTIASMSTRVEIAAGLEGSLERAGSARLERLPSRRSNKTRQTAKSTTLVAAFLEQNGYLHVNGAKWSWGRKRVRAAF